MVNQPSAICGLGREVEKMTNNILEVDNVTMQFGGLFALKDVSFAVKPKELFAIVGPNGAGKTTLFNVISGFYRPTSGKVSFLDQDISTAQPHEVARLGAVRTFQNLGVFESLTVLESVCLAKHRHLLGNNFLASFKNLVQPWRNVEQEARELIAFVGLEGFEDAESYNLPYGYQKRLEIARSLATEPKVLMLDEPAAGLNDEEKLDIRQVIRKVVERDIAVLLVEHDIKLVTDISDRAIVLDYGKLIAEGKPKEVMSDKRVIAAYIGERYTKRMEGKVITSDDNVESD